MTRFSTVDEASRDYDAYLRTDSSRESDMLYLSGFDAPDPFTLLRWDGETVLLVSPLEYGRARKESRADEVRRTTEYIEGDRRGEPDAEIRVLDAFLQDYGVSEIAVPRSFSLYRAEELRSRDYVVEPVDDRVLEARASKTEDEIGYIRAAQRATEEAMQQAEDLIANADVRNGVLYCDGEELTAERVKTEIEIELLHHRCSLADTIVACGERGSDPHWRGSGALEADEPIIVDIFPQHESHYHADMTRSYVRGSHSDAEEMYEAALEAQEAAFTVLERGAGVSGEEVHEAVCDSFENAGYPTLRDGGEEGFIHSTGHGVGLDVHELPRLSRGAGELEAGQVVTVEPGLYIEGIGGVRVEDLVVVRGDGYENLTGYGKSLEV